MTRGSNEKVHYIAYGKRGLSNETWSAIQAEYADQDIEVSREELLADEASAYYTESILGGKVTVDMLLGEEPTLAKKILNFFTGAARAYSGDEKLSKEARAHYRKFKKLFDSFAEFNKGRNAETAVERTGDGKAKRKTYASINADTADKMQLSNARQMLENNASSEEVRKATGWFRSYDGKWRFEISDADSYLIENPALKKHTDDGEVYFTGKLSDIFDHKELYAAYPELKDINVVIQKTELGVDGIYQPNSNYITLNIEQFKRHTKAYHDYLDGGRRAEIKSIEATDAYKEYNRLYDDAVMDEMDPTEWLEAEKAAREKFYSSELGKRYYQLMWGKDGFSGDKFEFGWAKPAKETLLHELQHAVQDIEGLASGTNTRDAAYDRNAGEIEARDTARRANMTAEERKNTRPDVDREDVVVKGDSAVSYFAKNAYDSETAVIKDQIRKSQELLNSMDIVFSGQAPRNFVSKTLAKAWALEELKKYGFQVDVKGVGVVEFEKNDIYGAIEHLKAAEEIAAIIAVPRVLKRGVQIGEHGNHKDRGKHTVTYAAPVEINGVRGNIGVVVNMRNKKYYVHRIILPDGTAFRFEKNIDAKQEMYQGVPKRSLANTTSSASKNSISQSAKKSTGSVKKVSEISAEGGKSIRFSKDITPKVAEESGIEKSIGKLGEGKVESVAGRDAKAGARRAAAYSQRRQDMTVGQLRQMVARYTGEKVYTPREARETIDNIWGIFTLSGKNRAKLYEALWQGYNSCKTDNERAEFSYDMAEYVTVMMRIRDSKSKRRISRQVLRRS